MTDVALETLLDAGFVRRWVRALGRAVDEQADLLTRLDAEIGDGDHGINMRRGMRAVVAALEGAPDLDAGALLQMVGRELLLTVGGAAGPLYGTAFLQAGKRLSGLSGFSAVQLSAAMEAALAGVQRLGAAEPGDKTMVDAFVPAVEALRAGLRSEAPLSESLEQAADAAEAGMIATIPLRALKGRASYLGLRSEGHQDPGATSTALLFRTLADTASL